MTITARPRYGPRYAAALLCTLTLVAPSLASAADDQTDLSITNVVDNALPDVGDTIIFTLSAHNAGPNDDINVSVSDTLATGLAFLSATGDGSFNSATGVWSIGNLTHDASATLHITATVGSTTDLDTATSVATITGGKADPDSSNNTASASINPQNADVSITKTVDTTSPAEGANITYTLTVTNHGDTAQNVMVTDSLPAGLVLLSTSGGTFASSTGTWAVGALADSASATLTLVASVAASTTASSIVNTASVTSDTYDPEAGNNTAMADAVVPGSAPSGGTPGNDTSSGTDTSTAPVAAPEVRHHGGGSGPGCAEGTAWSPSQNGCVPTTGTVLGASTSSALACGLPAGQYLRPGMRGAAVMHVQQLLIARGYGSFSPTGYYGPMTASAVKAFQRAYAASILTPLGLRAPTGNVYQMTLAQLNKVECGT